MSGEKRIRLCPRCGEPVSYFEERRVGERTYLYAVHRVPGEKTKRRCYLGPVGGYVYVSRLHEIREGMVLQGLAEEDRFVDYIASLASSLERLVSALDESVRAETLSRVAVHVERMYRAVREALVSELSSIASSASSLRQDFIDFLDRLGRADEEAFSLLQSLRELAEEASAPVGEGAGLRALVERVRSLSRRLAELSRAVETYRASRRPEKRSREEGTRV